jgi:hypothetical protein
VKGKGEMKGKEGRAKTNKCYLEGGTVHMAQKPATETHPKPFHIFKYYFPETKVSKVGSTSHQWSRSFICMICRNGIIKKNMQKIKKHKQALQNCRDTYGINHQVLDQTFSSFQAVWKKNSKPMFNDILLSLSYIHLGYLNGLFS